MQTTVLIENAAVLVAVGTALHRSHKSVLLLILIALLSHMAFDNMLLSYLKPGVSVSDNTAYYWSTSLFFLAMFGLFMANGVKSTKLSVIMAGCMIAQSALSFFVAINGACLNGIQLPDFDIVYAVHESFNKALWIIECIVVYIAATTEAN